MFTVKQITIDGEERHCAADEVRFVPPRGDVPGPAPSIDSPHRDGEVRISREHQIQTLLRGGTVFVYADSGALITRYDLGPSPIPHLDTDPVDHRALLSVLPTMRKADAEMPPPPAVSAFRGTR